MKIFKPILILLLLIAVVFGAYSAMRPADAATGNPNPSSTAYQIVALPISAITGTTAGIVKFTAPWPVRLECAYAVSQAVTNEVLLDIVNSAGTSLLSSKMTASTVTSQATLTTSSSTLNITDESVIAVSTSGAGSLTNATVTLCIKRR